MMWNFNRFRNQTALICEEGREITYGELEEMSSLLAKHLPGRSLCFNLCSNQEGSLLGYLTFINNGTVPLLLDAYLDRALLAGLIETYKPDYFWLPSSMEDEFEEKFPASEPVCRYYDYSLLKTPYTKSYPLNDELALLLTTSGSTGSFKMVRQSYRNIRANFESIVDYLQLDETERPITTLPMSYSYGLSIINSHLSVGASIILTSKTLVQKEFWQQFKEYEATSFGGVPYTYEILNRLNFFKMPLPSLRTMTQAGGKLSPVLHRRFAEYALAEGKQFVVMYGQTEATARMSYLPYEKALEKCGSMGIAIPGGKFSLIDGEGGEIEEPDTVGELVYEGPNVTLGYAETGEDLIKEDEGQGRLVTGDLAKRDSEGFYYIVGRKKRFLKIYGSRVNLEEIEQLIKARFDGLDCACTGVDDAMEIFVTEEGVLRAVKEFIADKTGINPVAYKVLYLESIPKNEAGKVLFNKLKS